MYELEYPYSNTIHNIQQQNIILQDQLWFYQNEHKEYAEEIFNLQK